MAGTFIGSGWTFPLSTDPAGRIALSSGDDELSEAIRLILGTVPGERPMRPEFGCRIHELVFSHPDAETAARVAYEVRSALVRWEPRIEVLSVDVSFDPAGEGSAFIDIKFTPATSNDPRNLVFPFYLIPEEQAAESAES
jgi:phage baseplate assembly protein W